MVVRKMKDKCKDAARMRREKERAEFVELSRLLPLPSSTTSQLDKASIIRLTSSYLRMRSAFPEGLGEDWGQHNKREQSRRTQEHRASLFDNQNNQQQIKELGSLLLQTLDGFVFAMHKDGKIMYISETASVHLGLPQIDLTGSSVFDYIHPSDREDIKQMLCLSESEKGQLHEIYAASTNLPADDDDNNTCNNKLEFGRSFCMRMKCILPKRNAGLVSSGYKAIHCNGYLKVRCRQDGERPTRSWESYALVAVGHSLLPSASTEVKLNNNSFMFRASLDFKFYFIESTMTDLLGFEQSDLIGQSLYQLVHLGDVQHLEQSHRLLIDKGQVVTRYYRLMKSDGGFIWIQSYATLVSNPRNMPKPQNIVSVCVILANDPFDQSQLLCDQAEASEKCAETIPSLDLSSSRVTINSQISSISTKSTNNIGNAARQQRRDKTLCQTQKKVKHQPASQRGKLARSQALVAEGAPCKRSPFEGAATERLCTFENYPPRQSISSANSRLTFETADNVFGVCTSNAQHNQVPNYIGIGSTRRASDDSCSIVSSVASTSVSSRSSLHHLTPESSYLPVGGCYLMNDNCPPDNQDNQQCQPSLPVQDIGSVDSKPHDSCHDKIALLREHLPMSIDVPIRCSDSVNWTQTEGIQPMHTDNQCNQHQVMLTEVHGGRTYECNLETSSQVGVPTSQPWMNSMSQMCSGSPFDNANVPPDMSGGHSPDYHHQEQRRHYHHQPVGELYVETHQHYNSCYANNQSQVTFQIHQLPPANNLYSV